MSKENYSPFKIDKPSLPCDNEHCPTCGASDVTNAHWRGDMAFPEAYYKTCEKCDAQWGHS